MRLIKRYSNRKLYDTQTRTYITLDGIAALVAEGADIKVVDNDTDEDLTNVVLSQLLLERERSRRSLPSGLLSGLLRSSETLGRGLSSLARPLPVSPGGFVAFLEHEIERSLKFWVEVGQGSEEEVLRQIEGLIEKRRKAKTAGPHIEAAQPTPPGFNLLRRRSLDDFEDWSQDKSKTSTTSAPVNSLAEQAGMLSRQARLLSEILAQNNLDVNTARQLEAELAEIAERLKNWETRI